MNDGAMTRVLQVSSYPPPLSGWSVRIQFLKARLEADGHVCTVLNIGPSRAVPSREYECVLGSRDYLAKLWRFSRRGFRVHAHVNGHSPKGLALALAAVVVNAWWKRRPVLTFHGGAAQSYFPRDRTPMWMYPAFVLLFGAASRIICNSDAVKSGLLGYGVRSDKIVPIPAFSTQYLAFDPVSLPPEIAAFLVARPELVFTYIRLRSVFYPETLMDAFERLAQANPRVGFLICGIGEHAEGDAARQFWTRANGPVLKDRIMVVADLERTTFLTVLAKARVCVRSPTTDGVSSSVLEALALRVPVVASENGHRPVGVITYDAENAQQLAEAVDRVLRDRDRIARELPPVAAEDTLSLEVRILTDP